MRWSTDAPLKRRQDRWHGRVKNESVGRGRRGRFDCWTRPGLDVDGDSLTWIRIRRDGRPPILEAFRLASRGALHPPVGLALLAEHGHPDAAACVISELTSLAPSS